MNQSLLGTGADRTIFPMPDGQTYIVTGGAGFVGANLAAALAKRRPGCRIVVIDDFRAGSYANLVEAFDRAGVGPFAGTVIPETVESVDFESLVERLRPDAFFHEGAITDTTVTDERAMLAVNTESFPAILAACLGHNVPLVYASSAATYGTPPEASQRKPFALTSAGRPNNIYGFSKWLMECEHRRAEERTGRVARVVGLRYFNVFGPGETRKGKMASMVYQLARQMLAGKPPRVFADGSQARDQVYVDDVVDCTLSAAGLGERPDPAPGVYNVGSGVATSFNQVIDALRDGLTISRGGLPTDYFEMPESVRAFYQDYTCADISETQRGLGWTPRWKPGAAIAEYARLLRAAGKPR